MPWKEATKMELRLEFVTLAAQPQANIARLCRRFGIARKTGYKWLERYRSEGIEGLEDRSRRPHHSPNKTPEQIEQTIVETRQRFPSWGGRKLRRWLLDRIRAGTVALEPAQIPAASTITRILDRRGLLSGLDRPDRQGPWKRFEYPAPNDLWQLDFKGEFPLDNQQLCYPLTLIDDHSRFGLAVAACPNQQRRTVQEHLQGVFRRYGLPEAILCDNGPPWGAGVRFPDGRPYYTKLGAWMIRLGIEMLHSGPGHPQSHGKNERFNRTLAAELLRYQRFRNHQQAQQKFNRWRVLYNTQRPHQALQMAVPADHYQPSKVGYPDRLSPISYGPDDAVRKVSAKGVISFQGKEYRIGKAFSGYPVAVRASLAEDEYKVYFCHQHIRTINLNHNP